MNEQASVAGQARLANEPYFVYLVQEEDGASRLVLEDEGGVIPLEESHGAGGSVVGEDRAAAVWIG